jgi:DNA-binding MarR family transcriptional regulator
MRVVASTIQAGYVERVASQADGRRVGLRLTDAGCALVDSVHRLRRRAFDEGMKDWTDAERRDFARLLTRVVERR